MVPKLTRRQVLKLLALAAGSSLTVLTKKSLTSRTTLASDQQENYLPIAQKDLTATPTVTPIPPTPTNTRRPTKTPIGAPTSTPTETVSPIDTPTITPTTPGVPSATPTHTPTSTSSVPTTPPAPPSSNTVVHMHSANVTSWNGGPDDYWNFVDQAVVDDMVDQGVMELTGTSSVADAWNALLPNFQAGQKVAIKVSFNNSGNCDDGPSIDGIIEPVNAVIRGLASIGVAQQDIWIFDAIRALPNHFTNGCDYPNVMFYDFEMGCNNLATFNSNDPNANVIFNTLPGSPNLSPQHLTDVVINADYLINIPIMKLHGSAGVSLAFKNHYGTVPDPMSLHIYSSIGSGDYTPDYSPLVDIHSNPHVGGKTILTLSDNIFCAMDNNVPPDPWISFGSQVPKSLFFSVDPVAIDCVMCDFLNVERELRGRGPLEAESDDYLVLAQEAGFGTYERGDPWQSPYGSGYGLIDYRRIDV